MATSDGRISIRKLIFVPALITLIITLLRLYAELHHWGRPWENAAAGGQGALIGIAWLPIIFGPYFAVRLLHADNRPRNAWVVVGLAVLGAVVWVGGGILAAKAGAPTAPLPLLGLLLMFAAAFIPSSVWGGLGRTLFAYAFAARIPVLVVMFFAMSASGGAGAGTHYDVVPARFATRSVGVRWFNCALLPQMLLWIGYTVVLGALCGGIAAAVAGRAKRAPEAA